MNGNLRERRDHRRKGSALIEGAMVMSLFLLLTISVVDLGHFLYQQHALVEHTRAAVRAGVVKSLTSEQIASMVVFGSPQKPDNTNLGFQGLRLENVDVKLLDRGTEEQRVVVRIRGLKRQTMTPFLAGAMETVGLEMSSPLEIP